MLKVLEVLGATIAILHFAIPLTYYLIVRRWYTRPWNVSVQNHTPEVTVVLPTYNEEKFIERKLENVYEQEYPKDRVEVLIIDSASTDKTVEIAKLWSEKHKDLKVKIIVENERKGKVHALNHALRYVDTDLVVIADVDAFWDEKALKEAVKWFCDGSIGAVSCIKTAGSKLESEYRRFYNVLRVGESKMHSTPIFHGELAVFRKHLLDAIGGFSTDVGADDSHAATRIALMGYRAIVSDDVLVTESVPKSGYLAWRVRRAQHLIQHFAKVLRMDKRQADKRFRKILAVETYLHLVNPWILVFSCALLALSAVHGSILAIGLLLSALLALALRSFRTWIFYQIFLVLASMRNLWTKDIAWSKQEK